MKSGGGQYLKRLQINKSILFYLCNCASASRAAARPRSFSSSAVGVFGLCRSANARASVSRTVLRNSLFAEDRRVRNIFNSPRSLSSISRCRSISSRKLSSWRRLASATPRACPSTPALRIAFSRSPARRVAPLCNFESCARVARTFSRSSAVSRFAVLPCASAASDSFSAASTDASCLPSACSFAVSS